MMPTIIPGIHVSAMPIVIPRIHLIAVMTHWLGIADRTLSLPMVRSAIHAQVATLDFAVPSSVGPVVLPAYPLVIWIAFSIHSVVISITLSVHPVGWTVLRHGRGKHYGYQ
jgi:hypothetical protein